MESFPRIYVLIPAWNEEKSLPLVIHGLPKDWVRQVVVCDNGSTDQTAKVAKEAGAQVIHQPLRGYGNACLAGMRYLYQLPSSEQPEIVVFLDGDFSDYPEELPKVVNPILTDKMDMVIGSRMLGGMEPDAMTVPQRFGNWLAPVLIRLIYGYRFSDLGPFRAIRWESLKAMDMQDRNYGWTVEMQVKAAKMRLKCTEVPVRYRKRTAGQSKVSGTIKGTVLAGWKIITTIFKLVF
ncbi:MAG TPA: UDP-glucose--dolichyl-phosphate glucosyltransferase [Saprospirales bacterium]|nr:UDP-glucose--dolichyl-phosphate glucosyltransferase [Saprospirales bacterium]